ncbi:MAG: hypothetical protein HKM02_08230 [Pseudomonadales bacterium]|nr:hypothetical protein [Pseudomonadales bacterium]
MKNMTVPCVLLACSGILLTSCAHSPVTGPTLRLYPAPGKSVAVFNLEDKACRSYAMEIIQDKNAKTPSPPSIRQQQRHYDFAYGQCMAARGNPMPPNSFWGEPNKPTILYIPNDVHYPDSSP